MRSMRFGWVPLLMLAVGASGVQAQRFGVQLDWSDDFDFGVGGRVEFDLEDMLSSEGPFSRTFVIGSFDYFFPDCDADIGPTDFDCSYWEINGNLAVPFTEGDESVDPYAGAGLNLAHFSFDYADDFPGGDVSDTEIGLNLLAGVKFPVGGLAAYLEGRFELSGGEQFVLTGGVLVGGAR